MGNIINPVLQDWVMSLDWKEQTGLISAIRGVDISDYELLEKECKSITKMIRFLVLNNADSKTSFMTDEVLSPTDIVSKLEYLYNQITLGNLPLHWSSHIFDAISIIIKKHPSKYIRMYWSTTRDIYRVNTLNKIEKEVDVIDNTIGESLVSELENAVDDVLVDCTLTKVDNSDTIHHTINGEDPIITDDKVYGHSNDICVSRGVETPITYLIQLERFVNDKDVLYNCINTDIVVESKFRNMLTILPQLDAIITNNWDVINDTMAADYKPDIPISKGSKLFIEKSEPGTFMVDVLSSNLLYKDMSGVLWIIINIVKDDIITLTISEPNYNRLEWSRLDNKSAYSLTPHKMSTKDDKYIHGEIRLKD